MELEIPVLVTLQSLSGRKVETLLLEWMEVGVGAGSGSNPFVNMVLNVSLTPLICNNKMKTYILHVFCC